jgi:hypothetical protein
MFKWMELSKKILQRQKNKNNRAKEKCLIHKKGRQIGALFLCEILSH